MDEDVTPGQIVILNGVPRSGKTSIAQMIQNTWDGVWINLGVDRFARRAVAKRFEPGIGLRPGPGPGFGGDNPPLERILPTLFAALYESIAAHSRIGLNVVVDIGHHGAIDPNILPDCARRLDGLPVLFVGVRCPIDVIMQRRRDSTPGKYEVGSEHEPTPPPAMLFQREVHKPGVYDMEVDTSVLSPEECAARIRDRLDNGPPPTAFAELAALS